MSLRTGNEAVAWGRAQVDNPSRDWTRLCLMYVRMCFNVAARYRTAEIGWYNTKYRHQSWPPPKGVPVWWTNGASGHVAISDGDGFCYSNDFLRTGKIDRVRIASITAGWGQQYRGWTEDVNGIRVYEPMKRAQLAWRNIARATREEDDVPMGRVLKRAVADEVGKGNMNLGTKKLGSAFRKQYQLVQRKYLKSVGVEPNGKNDDGIPGKNSLTWLGERQDFDVID